MAGVRRLLVPAVLGVVIGMTGGCALLYAETTVTTGVGQAIDDAGAGFEPSPPAGRTAGPAVTHGR